MIDLNEIQSHIDNFNYDKVCDILFPDIYTKLCGEELRSTREKILTIPEDVLKNSAVFCLMLASWFWDDSEFEQGNKWHLNLVSIKDAAKENTPERTRLNYLTSLLSLRIPTKDNAHLLLGMSILYNEYLRTNENIRYLMVTNGFPSTLRGTKDLSEWCINYRAVRSILSPMLSALGEENGKGIAEITTAELMYEKNKINEASLEIATFFGVENKELLLAGVAQLVRINRLDSSATSSAEILGNYNSVFSDTPDYLKLNYNAFKARLAMETGDLDSVTTWLSNDSGTIGKYALKEVYRIITRAKAYIALKKYRDAVVTLQAMSIILEKSYRPLDLAESMINLSIAFEFIGSQDLADEHLHRAINITRQYGYIRVYADMGNSLIPILHRYKSQHGFDSYLSSIYEATCNFALMYPYLFNENGSTHQMEIPANNIESKESSDTDKSILTESLTQTEADILKLLDEGRTNNEIAAAMDIKLSTVKFHVKNVLGKLGAKNRTEAIKFGRKHSYLS